MKNLPVLMTMWIRWIKATCTTQLLHSRPIEHLQEELGIKLDDADATVDGGCILAIGNLHGYYSSHKSL